MVCMYYCLFLACIGYFLIELASVYCSLNHTGLKVRIASQFRLLVTVKPGTCGTLAKSDVLGEEPHTTMI